MPVTCIDHINLRAPRHVLDELRDFYVHIVGLRVGERPLSSPGYWLYAAGPGAVLHLSQERPGESRPPHTRGTFDHIAFACTDLPAYLARLRAQGIDHRHVQSPAAGYQQVFFSDPVGNGVELKFPLPSPP
ncbi:VOC family protein [Acidihalobacter ferrooxydans]|uniref:Diguanylate cyclase n=1 Tax=Acidihalobacter ferrooxydans TaxID=1765967 RepID=A0A1P8UKM3_9GAMM|nr:VOC family protein [Acidihalobacter ferrooxydans]APZ44355.1 diguanylate cyclase [Acidihalobacter ferrooxydans]